MKIKLTETKFKSALGIAGQLFSRIACLGAVILICTSASAQNLFVSGGDAIGGKIFEFKPNGLQSIFASGLRQPQSLAFNSAGNLFVSDQGNNLIGSVIYEFKPNGVRSIFASGLTYPEGLAFDSAGNLFVAAGDNNSIFEFKPNGVRGTFAFLGLCSPTTGLAFDSAGNLFVADNCGGPLGSIIYKFQPNGVRSIFASGHALGETFAYLAFQPTACCQ